MNDPDAVEVDEEMTEGPLFQIRLEKGTVPIYAVKLQEALRWWQVYKSRL